jgi:hypothetical protein
MVMGRTRRKRELCTTRTQKRFLVQGEDGREESGEIGKVEKGKVEEMKSRR